MCNCFGKKEDNDKDKNKNREHRKISPATTDASKTTTTTCLASSPKLADPRSNICQLRSSPSGLKTNELTDVFEIPHSQSVAEILAQHGYELDDVIGEGSFAKVYKARRRSDCFVVACKVMEAGSQSRKTSAKNELFVMQRVSTSGHPHIIKLYQHFIVSIAGVQHVFIFMQFAERGSLSAYMRSTEVRTNQLTEAECKRFAAMIISALNYIHSRNVAHCDIKMGNVLLDKQLNCCLADFGLSRIAYRTSKGGTMMITKFCGTRSYMAPEVLITEECKAIRYNPFISDVWAFGTLMWCVVNQKYPFDIGKDMVAQQFARKIRFTRKLKWVPGKEVTDFFFRIFEPNVDERIKMPQLMVHPWVAHEVRLVEEKFNKATSFDASSSTTNTNTATDNSRTSPIKIMTKTRPNKLPKFNNLNAMKVTKASPRVFKS